MKNKWASILLTVFLISILAPAMTAAFANTGIANVTVRPDMITVGEFSRYQVSFTINEALTGGIDTVQIRFPSEYKFNTVGWHEGYADVNGQVSAGVSYSNSLLLILVPRNMTLQAGQTVIVSLSGTVMRNPEKSGDYSFSVNTSKETTPIASPIFTISEFVTSDGVSRPHVAMNPVKGYQAEEIVIRFSTNRGGQLIGSNGQIVLDFPSGFRFPQAIDEKTITINGIQMHTLSPIAAGSKLYLPLSPTMNFPENYAVEIVIAPNSGITVDRDVSDARLSVSTTSNTTAIESFPFSMRKTPDQPYVPPDDKDPGVTVAPNGAGALGQWTFAFARNTILLTEGELVIGFTITFPNGTVLPGTIAPQHITVNGQQSSGVLIDPARREVIFNLPIGFSTYFDMTVAISASAGIQNPPAAVYLMEITPRGSTKRMTTKPFEIKTASDPVQPAQPQPPDVQGDKVVKVTLNDPVAVKDGLAVILDVAPQLLDGFTFVPLRFVSEGLGAVVDYDNTQNTVTLTLGSRAIVLWPGSTLAKVDNVVVTLAKAPIIKDGRTLVPVRFVAECFGARVDFVSMADPIAITMTPDALANMPTVAEIQAAQAGASSGGGGSTGTGSGSGAGSGSSGGSSNGSNGSNTGSGTNPIGKSVTLRAGSSNANLRRGPGVSFELEGLLLPSEMAIIIGVEGDWYHVEFSYGLKAWIRGDLVEIK